MYFQECSQIPCIAAVRGNAAADASLTAAGLRYCSGLLTYRMGAYFRSMAAKEGSAMQPLMNGMCYHVALFNS